MKIRDGFVSNSSSSSFIALIPKSIFLNICASMSPLEEALMKKLSKKEVEFCSIPCNVECGYGEITFRDWVSSNEIIEDAKNIAKNRKEPYKCSEDPDLESIADKIERKIVNQKIGNVFIHTLNF